MSDEWLHISANLIATIQNGTRADLALRREFSGRRAGNAALRREVSLAVFDYFRWRGLLEDQKPLRSRIRQAASLAKKMGHSPQALETRQLRRLVPTWLSEWMVVTDDWIRSVQAPPALWIRCRRGLEDSVAAKLEGLHPAEAAPGPGAFVYRGERDLFQCAEFREGAFEIQDLSSQWVGALCEPRPGETWWDVCAGEGGKFLDLADRMENRGLVWVTDRSRARLKRLRQRAARAGVFNYRWREADLTAGAPFKVKFDGVLVDAPCSGIGTWQRNPDARWTLRPDDIEELSHRQKTILSQVARQVKPGGRLLYAVAPWLRQRQSMWRIGLIRNFGTLNLCRCWMGTGSGTRNGPARNLDVG